MDNWIAVVSGEHVQRGRAAGIMQVCHGKASALRRVSAGDRVALYSPTLTFRGKDRLRAFTALGIARDGEAYQFDMGGGFRPFRRDMDWFDTRDAPIQPLLDVLDFTAGNRNWGYKLRFGLFSISGHDMQAIAEAMTAMLPGSA